MQSVAMETAAMGGRTAPMTKWNHQQCEDWRPESGTWQSVAMETAAAMGGSYRDP
ncbi:unnamed protein product [Staurois parvus]|uniref:Uncharacterized protein n=1 Tax=Staurois parvus TaxID=386267 RepID=A0ABN9HRW3_9NEOB|nr:unnamed protein product [Staurois parvus]